MDPITRELQEHYAKTFKRHGAKSEGVDWGSDESRVELRYDKMAALIAVDDRNPSLLDVGAGFGGLLEHLQRRGMDVAYTGIDIVPDMISHAVEAHPRATWLVQDIFDFEPERTYDYVVCNGILTQKLGAGDGEMKRFAERLIMRMWQLSRRGIAFNMMSTHVNFMVDNLYYRDPVDLFAWCLEHVTAWVSIDHLYPPLHEFTVYLRREVEAG